MLTDDERAALKREYPNCYFTRVIKGGWSAIVAIPKPKGDVPRAGMFDCPELLHGATIRLQKS